MKTLFFLTFIIFSISMNSQSLYNAKANEKVSYKDNERFTVSFEKTNYGITFKRNDRTLTDALKNKIEQFMKNTNRPKFKGLGTFTLTIVKRSGDYFVIDQEKPERLVKL